MYSVLTVLIVILAVILILIVLVQNSKGGGLASNFASSNQIMGVRKTTDFLEKTTWGLIAAIVVLSIAAAGFHKSSTRNVTSTSEISNQLETPVSAPAGFDDAAPIAPIETAPIEAAPAEIPAE
ncbi:MAG: preprotein translocase subunit SecG [Candidatus Aphodosoma sp.]